MACIWAKVLQACSSALCGATACIVCMWTQNQGCSQAVWCNTGNCCKNTLGSLCVWFWINFWLLHVQRPFTVLQYFGTLTFSYKSSYRSPNLNLWSCLLHFVRKLPFALCSNYFRCQRARCWDHRELKRQLTASFQFQQRSLTGGLPYSCRSFPFLHSWQHCFTVVYCTQPSCLLFPTSQHLHLSYSTQKNFKI